jgi:drug/metabolite transporter (DMT)-like permease
LLVVAAGHIVSFLILVALCLALRSSLPGTRSLALAALGGFEGSLALAVFYRALAMGAMGLTAALTGLITALLPVLFSLFHDGLPSRLTALGLATGCVAIWLITHAPAAKDATVSTPPAALLLGALAGLGFGSQLILFRFAGIGAGVLWPMTAARAAGAAAVVLVILFFPPQGAWKGFWLTGIAAGALDTIGNLFYIRATQLGRMDVAAVICSMYPAGTILLATLVLREWPTRRQMAGMALALAAVAMLSI